MLYNIYQCVPMVIIKKLFIRISLMYIFIYSVLFIPKSYAESISQFKWKFSKGEILQIKKTSVQQIKFNENKVEREVVHRILLNVNDAKKDIYSLSGEFFSKFRYLDPYSDKTYQEEEKHISSFIMEENGEMKVSNKFYMPNVRNIPAFPKDSNLSIGSTWKYPGHEIMEFGTRMDVPFDVQYEYAGKEKVRLKDGRELILHKIIFRYHIDYNSESENPDNPNKLLGFNTGIVYWNLQDSIPYFSLENYKLLIMMKNGDTSEIYINAKSYYKKIKPQKIDQIKKEIVDNIKIENPEKTLDVHKDNNGNLKINLPGIYFDHDSNELNDSAQKTLLGLVEVLEKVDNIQLLIKGHTDSSGDKDYNKELSEKRAHTVTEFMLENSKIPQDSISFKGMGEISPIADNSTPEGRAKNRRVEIIILRK